jgi:hypothetical protein
MTLGASLASQITQPISGVAINASTGLRMLAAYPPNIDGARETLKRTLRDCDRASDMVAQLRVLLRPAGAASARRAAGDRPGGT